MKVVIILAALSILNSSGASPGATEKVAALVARATCSGASHSSGFNIPYFRWKSHQQNDRFQHTLLPIEVSPLKRLVSSLPAAAQSLTNKTTGFIIASCRSKSHPKNYWFHHCQLPLKVSPTKRLVSSLPAAARSLTNKTTGFIIASCR